MKNQDFLTRVLPHSAEAESAVLGSVFLSDLALPTVISVITHPDIFYVTKNRVIYKAILDLYDLNIPIDVITVSEHLNKSGDFEKIGGMAYLSQLTDNVVSAVNVHSYAVIIREKYLLRMLINESVKIMEQSYKEDKDVSSILEEAQSGIFKIAQDEIEKKYVKAGSLLDDMTKKLEDLKKQKRSVVGLKTGFYRLDELTLGFQPGQLVILAARPGVGKTSFALNIASNVSVEEKRPVLIFSLEMTKEELLNRLMCSMARILPKKLRTGNISAEDWLKFSEQADKLLKSPLYINDSSKITPLEMLAHARLLKKEENDLGLIIVDYLQLMTLPYRTESRQVEISNISRMLKTLAKELSVPVLALSQLNRLVEQRGGDKMPKLSDLRESGSIEQDADIVMFIKREDDDEENPDKTADLKIAKQRSGPAPEMIKLVFLDEYTRFENYTSEEYADVPD